MTATYFCYRWSSTFASAAQDPHVSWEGVLHLGKGPLIMDMPQGIYMTGKEVLKSMGFRQLYGTQRHLFGIAHCPPKKLATLSPLEKRILTPIQSHGQ